MKQKAPKPIHDYYSKLGKKSAKARQKRILEAAQKAQEGAVDKPLDEKRTNE
ncbi:MAG: hypothetical protein AAB875_03090 [Patescibacteria group bacterium]